MSDPLIRACDHYVVLEPAGAERLLTAAETLDWLVAQLEALEAQRLLETACELEWEPGVSVQWFAVRLDPPGS